MELPEFFAIDIGSSSIKLVQVKRKGDNAAELQKMVKIATPQGLIENEGEEGNLQLAVKIEEARNAAGISTKSCIMAVPESAVFSRLLTIPKVENQNIEETVHWEVKPMIPVPLTDVDIAFLDIGEKEVAGKKLIDMYVVAAPKTLIDRYKNIATKAGLELLAIETESLAITRAITFAKNGTAGDFVIIDIGAGATNIVLARNGAVVFTQTSSTGSEALTKAIASDYGIDYAEAEKYKRAFGINFDQGEGKIAKSIEPILQIIITDVARAISFFRERVGGKLSDTIFLTGDGANLPGLPNYITAKLNIKAEIVNIFANIEINRDLKKEMEQSTQAGLSVALGLGLKTTED